LGGGVSDNSKCALDDQMKVHFSSERQNWKTPKAFYQALDAEFSFDFDPCPPRAGFDGLSVEWGMINYVNPPYEDCAKWCQKAYEESLKGKTIVLLIPSRTDTRYWHDYVMRANEIRFIKGRLKFDDQKYNAPFPSAIIVFKPHTQGERR
jgi:hypothetical protein